MCKSKFNHTNCKNDHNKYFFFFKKIFEYQYVGIDRTEGGYHSKLTPHKAIHLHEIDKLELEEKEIKIK